MKLRLTGEEDTAKNRFDKKIEIIAMELLQETGMEVKKIEVIWETNMISSTERTTVGEKDIQVANIVSHFS